MKGVITTPYGCTIRSQYRDPRNAKTVLVYPITNSVLLIHHGLHYACFKQLSFIVRLLKKSYVTPSYVR